MTSSTTACVITVVTCMHIQLIQLNKICMGTGGIGRTNVKFDRTNLALYWQFDSTSEKVILSPVM